MIVILIDVSQVNNSDSDVVNAPSRLDYTNIGTGILPNWKRPVIKPSTLSTCILTSLIINTLMSSMVSCGFW